MGYDLHITRKEHWFDDEGEEITLSEWLDYINSDQELNITDTNELDNIENTSSPLGYCEWNVHPLNDKWWFDYSNGNIYTKNPDNDTIIKMLSIAEKLNAKVQGDDGEVYGLLSNEISHNQVSYTNEKTTTPVQVKIKRPWWKVW